MALISMQKLPKLKLFASSNAAFRVFVPIEIDGLVPANLSAYQWRAQCRDGLTVGAIQTLALVCTATATGVWLSAPEASVTAALVGATATTRLLYGNLLFEQPDLTGVHIPAAEIELEINAGDTVWTA